MNKEDKGRVWATIIYPESVPDWEHRLEDLHIPAYVNTRILTSLSYLVVRSCDWFLRQIKGKSFRRTGY